LSTPLAGASPYWSAGVAVAILVDPKMQSRTFAQPAYAHCSEK
jgi:hypothetical protein